MAVRERNEHFWISIHSTTRVETKKRVPCLLRWNYFNPLHHEGGDHDKTRNLGSTSTFQSTPPRGWRLDFAVQLRIIITYFNPLHHEGGDEYVIWLDFVYQNFNPLHHEGGDLLQRQPMFSQYQFQSTPPRGWRLGEHVNLRYSAIFQSTPPRGWRR